jgi:hypothetical protein
MKSEKAKRYLLKVVAPTATMYPEYPEECDLKLGEAKRAVELAEQEAEARMRKELTRWNDPNKPPTDEMRVIAKVVLPNGATLVTGAWYAVNEFPTGWSVDLDRTFENLHVLGWRPIYENE